MENGGKPIWKEWREIFKGLCVKTKPSNPVVHPFDLICRDEPFPGDKDDVRLLMRTVGLLNSGSKGYTQFAERYRELRALKTMLSRKFEMSSRLKAYTWLEFARPGECFLTINYQAIQGGWVYQYAKRLLALKVHGAEDLRAIIGCGGYNTATLDKCIACETISEYSLKKDLGQVKIPPFSVGAFLNLDRIARSGEQNARIADELMNLWLKEERGWREGLKKHARALMLNACVHEDYATFVGLIERIGLGAIKRACTKPDLNGFVPFFYTLFRNGGTSDGRIENVLSPLNARQCRNRLVWPEDQRKICEKLMELGCDADRKCKYGFSWNDMLSVLDHWVRNQGRLFGNQFCYSAWDYKYVEKGVNV